MGEWRVITYAVAVPVERIRGREVSLLRHGPVGHPELKERWKRGVALVEGALGEAVGKVYVERHFSPVAKERMDDPRRQPASRRTAARSPSWTG